MLNKSKIIISIIFTLTLIVTGAVFAGSLTTQDIPTPTMHSISDIYALIDNTATSTPTLSPIQSLGQSSMNSVSELYVKLANLIHAEDLASTSVTYLGVTGGTAEDTPTPVATSTKEFNPTSTAGDVTGYNLDDIYNLITENTRPTTIPTRDFAPASTPTTGTMHSLNDIYIALANLIDEENIIENVTYLGKVGNYVPVISYSITFDRNGGDYGTMLPQFIAENTSANLIANVFIKNLHTFLGWNTSPNGSGIDYADQASFSMGSANVTLYAKWQLTLTWSESFGPSSWDNATVACVNRGERLPTKYELTDGMYDQFNGWGQTSGFVEETKYWSSSFNDMYRPYFVYYQDGRVSSEYDTDPHLYRCVK